MTTTATLSGSKPRRPRRPIAAGSVGAWVISVVFLFFFAYDVWEALGNLIGLGSVADQLGVSLNSTGWAVLVAGIAAPVVCFVAAVLLSRGRSNLIRIVIFVAALCLSAVLALDTQLVFGVESLLDLG